MAQACEFLFLDLGPDLLHRVARFLPRNDIVLGLRRACKPLAQQFSGKYAEVSPQEFVPEQLFAERWGSPEAWLGLTCKRRLQLVSLMAASGVVQNLQLAVKRADCSLTNAPLMAAAKAGRLEACRWLLAYPDTCQPLNFNGAMAEAVRGGHSDVCKLLLDAARAAGRASGAQNALDPATPVFQPFHRYLFSAAEHGRKELITWMLDNGARWTPNAAGFAARGGHWELPEWLLELHRGKQQNGLTAEPFP